jgi:hypothetical protein
MIIYLYKKTHTVTGLQYLGKTKRLDPHKYKGSGKDWKAHIKEHGYTVVTEILKECHSNEELNVWGRYYSKLWNVADSLNWANRIPETGGGSPSKGRVFTENHKQRIKENHWSTNPNYTRDYVGEKHHMKDPIYVEKYKGDNNYQTKPDFKYNSIVFTWKHKTTGEIVTMTHLDFYRTYNLRSCNVVRTIKGKSKSVAGWELIA